MKIHTQFWIDRERKANFKTKCFVEGRTQSWVVEYFMDYYITKGLPSECPAHTKPQTKLQYPSADDILEYAKTQGISNFYIKDLTRPKENVPVKFVEICHQMGIKDDRTIRSRWKMVVDIKRGT